MRRSWQDIFALAGSLAMVLYGIHRLPDADELLQLPRTPIDRSRIHASATEYRLLLDAGKVIPEGARVVVRSSTGDVERDTYLHWFGVALLPGRRVLPAAAEGKPVPAAEASADYVVVLGRGAPVPDRVLLLETADGTVWRKGR